MGLLWKVVFWGRHWEVEITKGLMTNQVDMEKLVNSLNIPKDPRKRCPIQQTENSTQIWFDKSCLVRLEHNSTIHIYVQPMCDLFDNVERVLKMLKNFTK